MPLHCHKLIFQTALEMAHALYDTMMQDNTWYDLWKKQNPGVSPKGLEERFVKRNHAKMVPQARETLAGMLRGPYPTDLKDQIMEALSLDNTLRLGRPRMVRVNKTLH